MWAAISARACAMVFHSVPRVKLLELPEKDSMNAYDFGSG